jgi:hypothetical protein
MIPPKVPVAMRATKDSEINLPIRSVNTSSVPNSEDVGSLRHYNDPSDSDRNDRWVKKRLVLMSEEQSCWNHYRRFIM